MDNLFDEDALQRYFRRMGIEQQNKQTESQALAGMSEATNPPPNPYAGGGQKKSGFFGTVGKIAAPVMKLAGAGASLFGMPAIGVPLTMAGSVIGGATEGGLQGALKSLGKSGITEAATFGLGKGMGALADMGKAPEAIMTGSKLSAPLGAAMKSPEMMSSLGGNLAVVDPVRKLTMPYAGASGMDVMNVMNARRGGS